MSSDYVAPRCRSLGYLTLFLLLCCIPLANSDRCPNHVTREIMECQSQIAANVTEERVLTTGDVHLLRKLCRTGKIKRPVQCIESLFRLCRGVSPNESILRKLVDPELMRSTYQNFCQNIDVYAAHAECIRDNTQRIDECSRQQMLTFSPESGDIKEKFCRFHRSLANCLIVPLRNNCGESIGNLMEKYTRGTMPIMCNRTNRYSASLFSVFWLLSLVYTMATSWKDTRFRKSTSRL